MGKFEKGIKGTVYGVNWKQVGEPIHLDADDLRIYKDAVVTEGLYGPNLRLNRVDGGYRSKKISPRMDLTKLPIGTKVDLTKIALCTLSKPGEEQLYQNFEIDGYLLPEYETAE